MMGFEPQSTRWEFRMLSTCLAWGLLGNNLNFDYKSHTCIICSLNTVFPHIVSALE